MNTPRLSWRRLGVLVRHLPHDSAIARAVHGEQADWGPVEHLLAGVIDRLEVANWQRANHGAKKAAQSKPPKPMPRPGQAQKQQARRTDTYARLQEQRGRLRARSHHQGDDHGS